LIAVLYCLILHMQHVIHCMWCFCYTLSRSELLYSLCRTSYSMQRICLCIQRLD
jgi:hypothetical protein